MGIAHFTVYLGLCYHGGYRVQNDNVQRARTHQSLGYFKSLLAAVGLGNKHIVNVNAKRLCVDRVESVLHVDKGYLAADFLCFRDYLQSHRCFTGAFGTVHLHDPSAGYSAYSQSHIQGHGAGRYRVNVKVGSLTQLHYRALAVLLFNMRYRRFESLFLFVRACELDDRFFFFGFLLLCHIIPPLKIEHFFLF